MVAQTKLKHSVTSITNTHECERVFCVLFSKTITGNENCCSAPSNQLTHKDEKNLMKKTQQQQQQSQRQQHNHTHIAAEATSAHMTFDGIHVQITVPKNENKITIIFFVRPRWHCLGNRFFSVPPSCLPVRSVFQRTLQIHIRVCFISFFLYDFVFDVCLLFVTTVPLYCRTAFGARAVSVDFSDDFPCANSLTILQNPMKRSKRRYFSIRLTLKHLLL